MVAVELRRLSAGTKKALWRARQLQNRAYNWGVEHALGLHYAGERIPSPRVDAAALTRLRHRCPENRKGGLRLQRGGLVSGGLGGHHMVAASSFAHWGAVPLGGEGGRPPLNV